MRGQTGGGLSGQENNSVECQTGSQVSALIFTRKTDNKTSRLSVCKVTSGLDKDRVQISTRSFSL